jgi:hypothetical protein
MATSVSTAPDTDPVVRRIQRVLDRKRLDNERAIGAIEGVEGSWEAMNKEIDVAVDADFVVARADLEALERTKTELRKPPSGADPDAFTLGGKIEDPDGQAGLPNVAVRVLHVLDDGTEEELTTGRTDALGNFVASVPVDRLPPPQRNLNLLRIEAFSAADETHPEEAERVLAHELKVRLEAGETKEVKLAAMKRAGIKSSIVAGISTGDSVAFAADTVATRLERMGLSHTALLRFSARTRTDLDDVRADLATPTPDAAAVFGFGDGDAENGGTGDGSVGDRPGTGGSTTAGDQPGAPGAPPTGRPGAEPPSQGDPRTRLRRVRGLGPESVKRLLKARIETLEDFANAPTERLKDILGDRDLDRMKSDAATLSGLERVKSVGETRAGKLRAAGIRDLQDLVDATPDELKAALGGVDTATIRRSSAALLRGVKG